MTSALWHLLSAQKNCSSYTHSRVSLPFSSSSCPGGLITKETPHRRGLFDAVRKALGGNRLSPTLQSLIVGWSGERERERESRETKVEQASGLCLLPKEERGRGEADERLIRMDGW